MFQRNVDLCLENLNMGRDTHNFVKSFFLLETNLTGEQDSKLKLVMCNNKHGCFLHIVCVLEFFRTQLSENWMCFVIICSRGEVPAQWTH
jgi:hypothetical protein